MSVRTAKLGKSLHKWIRFSAGFVFWLHALLLFALPLPPLEHSARRLNMNVSEMLLGMFFITVSVINVYGFWKFLLDLLYIYVFPFIFLYKFCVVMFKTARHLTRQAFTVFKVPGAPPITWIDFAKQWTADDGPWRALAQPLASKVIETVATGANAKEPKAAKVVKKILLPLRSFTMAWCLVIVSTNREWLITTGLIIICLHLTLFFLRLVGGIFSMKNLLANGERKITAYVTGLLKLLMAATDDEALANQDIANAANMLALFRGGAFLLIHRAEMRYLFIFSTFLMYVGIYARIAILFGFIYLGIAKLHHIPLTFADSMVNSFVMPASYTNLPHDWVIQLAEDFHTFIALFLGIETLYSYVQSKIEGLQAAAGGIWEMLDPTEVRERMASSAKQAAALRQKAIKPPGVVIDQPAKTDLVDGTSTA